MHVVRELRDEKLDFWIQNDLNVLFVGHYGAGKTTRILDAFNRNKLKYKYFSASTMDPWCDFIGVPKVMSDENGPYLDYVLPRELRDNTIEAIYMDEFNRSHKKVRNAVMELLQFKSINGRPFSKLRIIWAAINPEEEGDYQVEALDKAQKDRFQVQIAIPYEPSLPYFINKFDTKQAKAAVNWWQALTPEQQMEVSPRRLEYALKMYNLPGGNIKDVLPHGANPSKLISLLKLGPIDDRMKDFFKNNDLIGATKFIQVENNYSNALPLITNNVPKNTNADEWKKFFLQAIGAEKLTALISTNEDAYLSFIEHSKDVPFFQRVIRDIISTNTDKIMARRLRKEIDNNMNLLGIIYGNSNGVAEKPYCSNRVSSMQWAARLANWISQPTDTTLQRMKIYEDIVDWLPKTMTLIEAVDTLEMISILVGRSHKDTLKQFRHLLGVVNHCIEQIHKSSGLSWNEILTNYSQKFDKLLGKLRDADLGKKLLCPARKAN